MAVDGVNGMGMGTTGHEDATMVTRRRLLRGVVTGGLLVAAVPLVAACGGAPASAGKPAASGTVKPAGGDTKPGADGPTVDMNDQNKYVPESITVKKGTTVTWRNIGLMVHNVQTDPTGAMDKNNAVVPAGAKTFASPMIEAGKTWSTTFDVVGNYTYFCLPHQALGMVGKVTVTE
jgi:plastocyanin